MIFGTEEVTSGASDDLARATGLAINAVGAWGFDDIWGCSIDQAGLAGGTALPAELQSRVKIWLATAQKQAVALLKDHKDELNRIAETLVANQAVTGDELHALLELSQSAIHKDADLSPIPPALGPSSSQ